MTLEIEIGDGPLTIILMLESLGVGGGGCTLDYNVSSGTFLSYEIENWDGPGPKLDKNVFIINMAMNSYYGKIFNFLLFSWLCPIQNV